MRTTPFRVMAVAAILSTCGAVIVSAGKAEDSVLDDVAGYRQWTRVTPVMQVVTLDASSIAG